MTSGMSEEEASNASTASTTEPAADTGDAAVDSAIAPLAELAASDLDEHVEVFERVHHHLAAALDAGPDSS